MAAFLPLVACGFEPVYGTGSAARDLFDKLEIVVKKGRFDFEYRNRLVERIGAADAGAPYQLRYDISVSSKDVVISEADKIERYTLEGVVRFEVFDNGLQEVVFKAEAFSNTAYSVTASTYPTEIARRDANIRLVHELAEKTVTLLSVKAQDWVK